MCKYKQENICANFVEISKTLIRYMSENNIALNHENNYVRHSDWLLEC